MNEVEKNLTNWGRSLTQSIPIGGLLARNPIAYKWKSLYRIWMLRELAFWREHDLMAQSYALHLQGYGLGARILLRSGFETLATLTYLNMLIQQVLDGTLNFHRFSEKTSLLLLGSRNNDAMPVAINIITVLAKCDKRYPGLMKTFENLSESAHPNWEGLMYGYSETNYDEHETTFKNRWIELYGDRHLDAMMICIGTFDYEYDCVWPELVDRLEAWVVDYDVELEATKDELSTN